MDWGSLVARRSKKDPADQGGWNIFLTAWVGADIMNPLTSARSAAMVKRAGRAGRPTLNSKNCATSMRVPRPRPTKTYRRGGAGARHASGHARDPGEYKNPAAVRKNISGVLKTAGSAYWNIQKN